MAGGQPEPDLGPDVEWDLDGTPRERFDAWLDAAVARHAPPLTFAEVRKGVRALSSLWVERRERASRALDGAGKRAAFATYYAPLHFLAAWHALARVPPTGARRRVLDLGCGTGAVGAAAALALGAREVVGCDRSAWALREAAHTWAAFGLRGRARRTALPRGLPRFDATDLVALGWSANELAPAARDELLTALLRARRRDASLLVLEPLAGAAAPWWDAWTEALAPAGARSFVLRVRPALPDWIRRLDHAAGLDHATLGARVLVAPAAADRRGA